MYKTATLLLTATLLCANTLFAQPTTEPSTMEGPYKVLKSEKVGGEGGFDYVYADAATRHLFIVRSVRPTGRCDIYDLDTLKPAGMISDVAGGHGVAIDSASAHGFTSSNPVVMFDAKSLATIKTLPVDGRPDGIFAEPVSGHIYVLSHSAPNVTMINGADGSIVGTIDLGGAPEQGVSDGRGHAYVDIEDQDKIAVIDTAKNVVTSTFELKGKGGNPAGLAIDVKNNILFAFCRRPAVCIVMNATDGTILETLPIGSGVDAAEFNPETMEAFSSQGDGTLTVIKEVDPTHFVVEQTVATKPGGKCSTLDAKTGNVYITSAERGAPSSQPTTSSQGERAGRGGRGGPMVPGSFTITVVGK